MSKENNLLGGSQSAPKKENQNECIGREFIRYEKSVSDLAMEIGENLDGFMRSKMVNRPDKTFTREEINGELSNILLGVIARDNFEKNISRSKRSSNRKAVKNKLQNFVIETVGSLMPAILKSMEKEPIAPVATVSGKGKNPIRR